MRRVTRIVSVLAIALLTVGAINAFAEDKAKLSSEQKRAVEATEALKEIMGIPETIPEDLMKRAHGIAVIPHVVKGAFGLGGQWGKGLMAQRREDGTWSSPSFVEIGGGSFGLQIGVQASDIILIFTDEDGLRGLMKSKIKLGADASVAAGPVGRKAEVGTDVLLKSGVFAYSRSKGLFAGISLDGSGVGVDDSANAKVYGKGVTGEQILFGGKTTTDAQIRGFMKELQAASPPHVHLTAQKKSD
jgi:lipid-binding SYLF domain-containing protein